MFKGRGAGASCSKCTDEMLPHAGDVRRQDGWYGSGSDSGSGEDESWPDAEAGLKAAPRTTPPKPRQIVPPPVVFEPPPIPVDFSTVNRGENWNRHLNELSF